MSRRPTSQPPILSAVDPEAGPYGFWTRRPRVGQSLRLLGHVAALTAAWLIYLQAGWALVCLLIFLLLLWLVAWRLEVGSLWRSTLVSACVVTVLGVALWSAGAWEPIL